MLQPGGNITIGDEDTDSIEFGAEVDSNIVPNVDGTFNLGFKTPKDGITYTVTIGQTVISILLVIR